MEITISMCQFGLTPVRFQHFNSIKFKCLIILGLNYVYVEFLVATPTEPPQRLASCRATNAFKGLRGSAGDRFFRTVRIFEIALHVIRQNFSYLKHVGG